jgi:ketosteroid isomerase-like protein
VDTQVEELVKALVDAWARADRDAFLALMHPDAESWLPRSALEGGAPYRGLQGAAQAWADGFDIWERFEGELREFRYVGDVLVAEFRVRCIPRGEGPPVEYDGHYVTELRDGKVAYWRPYLDRADAAADAEARAATRLRAATAATPAGSSASRRR